MHGKKKRPTRADGAAEIDGCNIVWSLTSEPVENGDGKKGLRISAQLAEGHHRELIIEFPYDTAAFHPQKPKFAPGQIEAEIRLAIADGWNPESRGRAFLFMSDTPLEPTYRPGQAAYRARN
ncbi:hypothetical protein BH11PSE2_BH11PSE2_08180 [soil metagenome]